MLSCSEPKVVLDSYQSLLKYLRCVLLPSLKKNSSCVLTKTDTHSELMKEEKSSEHTNEDTVGELTNENATYEPTKDDTISELVNEDPSDDAPCQLTNDDGEYCKLTKEDKECSKLMKEDNECSKLTKEDKECSKLTKEDTSYEFTVEIISVLVKFLQNVSMHWLRYPQSVIESLSKQSLMLFLHEDNDFRPSIWSCVAVLDSEAKWLKNMLHGHVSRTAFYASMIENSDVLRYVVNFCQEFLNIEDYIKASCCERPNYFKDVSHKLCFLANLLQYHEGHKLLDTLSFENVSSDWLKVLELLMDCTRQFSRRTCFECSGNVCAVVSKTWKSFWISDFAFTSPGELIKLLLPSNYSLSSSELLSANFAILCIIENLEYIDSLPRELKSTVDDFVIKLFNFGIEFFRDRSLSEPLQPDALRIYNSFLLLTKELLNIPSVTFLNEAFIDIFRDWVTKVKSFSDIKIISGTDIDTKRKLRQVASDIEQNTFDVFRKLLIHPVCINICHEASIFETCINVLLENMLKDIKLKNSVCPVDLSVLSQALNSNITHQCALNKITVFRLSSVIWYLKDDDMELGPLKTVLTNLLPFIFNDLPPNCLNSEDDSNHCLQKVLLLLPSSLDDVLSIEEYQVLALEVLSTVACSIQSFSKLEDQFDISKLLLERQIESTNIDGSPIIDQIFLLRNHILAKFSAIGGPSEKRLPTEYLDTDAIGPIIKCTTTSDELYLPICQTDTSVEVENIVVDNYFQEYLKNSNFSYEVVFQILKSSQFSQELPEDTHETPRLLSKGHLKVLDLVHQYGVHLKLLQIDKDSFQELLNSASCISNNDNRLDLFSCIICLMCRGDRDLVLNFVQGFKQSTNSLFIWKALNFSKDRSKIHYAILEFCDILVKTAIPEVYSALQMQGILPSAVYTFWAHQYFLNFLDFPEICDYVISSFLKSGEFSVYFFVAVLKHLKPVILDHAHCEELFTFLIKNPIVGFETRNYVDFMYDLSESFVDLSNIILGLAKDVTFLALETHSK